MLIQVEEIPEIVIRSLMISGMATFISTSWSLPLVLEILLSKTKVKEIILGIMNSLVGIPTVLVGLILYFLLSRSGPLGYLRLLYTPYAIIIGQAILITPLTISLLYEVMHKAMNDYWELALSLGAPRKRALMFVIEQSISDIIVSSLISFSRAIGELGVALLVGGNVKGMTRVITTTIALAVESGEFELAIYLGACLLLIVTSITASVRLVRTWREE